MHIVPLILFLSAGAACLLVWWRYGASAKEVFMDADNLYELPNLATPHTMPAPFVGLG
jgi:hypothetical protein